MFSILETKCMGLKLKKNKFRTMEENTANLLVFEGKRLLGTADNIEMNQLRYSRILLDGKSNTGDFEFDNFFRQATFYT